MIFFLFEMTIFKYGFNIVIATGFASILYEFLIIAIFCFNVFELIYLYGAKKYGYDFFILNIKILVGVTKLKMVFNSYDKKAQWTKY